MLEWGDGFAVINVSGQPISALATMVHPSVRPPSLSQNTRVSAGLAEAAMLFAGLADFKRSPPVASKNNSLGLTMMCVFQ